MGAHVSFTAIFNLATRILVSSRSWKAIMNAATVIRVAIVAITSFFRLVQTIPKHVNVEGSASDVTPTTGIVPSVSADESTAPFDLAVS